MDARANLAKVQVNQGYTSSATSITLLATDPNLSRLPDPANGNYDLIWWNATDYNDPSDDPNAEFVRATARASNVYTITRAQQTSAASNKNTTGKTYKVAMAVTAKTLDDLEAGYDITRFGAKTSAADNSTAIQAAIDAASAAGGGIVHIPVGTFQYATSLSLKPQTILRGRGTNASVLDYTPATGNGIVLAANPYNVRIEDLKIRSNGNSTGWAITGSLAVVGDVRIQRCEISAFLKGIILEADALDCTLDQVRLTGQGKSVAGGIGVQFGNATFGGNGMRAYDCYTSSYELHWKIFSQAFLISGEIPETGKIAFQFLGSAAGVVIIPWNGSSPSNFDVHDFDLKSGNGVCLFGYGSQSWNTSEGKTITGATNATPIVVTTQWGHGFTTGDSVKIRDVLGNAAANGTWTVTSVTETTFSLDTSVGNGAYTSGGVARPAVASARNRMIVIPERMDSAPGALQRGVQFGRTQIYNDGAANRLSMGRDDKLEWRDSADADGVAEVNLYHPSTDVIRTDDWLEIAGRLKTEGSRVHKRTTTAGDYTALTTDYYIGVTSTAAARLITLPAVASTAVGLMLVVKDESGGAATNNITVDGNASELIDGSATYVISANYGAVRLINNGTKWLVI